MVIARDEVLAGDEQVRGLASIPPVRVVFVNCGWQFCTSAEDYSENPSNFSFKPTTRPRK